jgi:hypothetical protein
MKKEISVEKVKKIVKKTRSELIEEVRNNCINKELEPYGLTIEDVMGKKAVFKKFEFKMKTFFGFVKYPTFFKTIPWYQYCTFKTEEQFESWKAFCILELISKLKMTKEQAEEEFNWMNLNYGLKQEYLYGNKG